jgi:radical SAM family uncharacterized protein
MRPLLTSSQIQDRLQRLLPTVQKPGRYVGGEYNQIVKDWEAIETKTALVFPDIYDIGLPNLGLAILYDIINKQPDLLAERAFAPWLDMEAAIRTAQIPLFSLETKHALADFDILAFTLPYESLYTNTLNILDLAGIPLYSHERQDSQPLVIAGGHATYNPEPMAAFIDAFIIGEGEEVILEFIREYQNAKRSKLTRQQILMNLSRIQGVYVPSFYQPTYHDDGTVASLTPVQPDVPKSITKRIVANLPPPPTKFIVPSIDVVHNRVSIEIMRGCTRGCRFCHAGMVTRPVRERTVEQIVNAAAEALATTGFEEIALLSLSSSDYTHINELVSAIQSRFQQQHLVISLPSLRIESFSVDIMDKLRGSRQGGFTLAPEAGTDRMRSIINKPIAAEQLLETAQQIYSRGWSTLKLYFMIGHPEETLEDVQAIADLCRAVIQVGRQAIGKRANLHVGISTFVPKPHTPFQWVACDTPDQILAKQQLLRRDLRLPGVKINWTDSRETMMEAWLSRGDRRMGEVIKTAWQNGAKFDAWQDEFRIELWISAFESQGLSPDFYTHRLRGTEEIFPWDHIHTGVRKSYLLQEYKNSHSGTLRADCRTECFACGILPTFNQLRRENPGDSWKCPEVNISQSVEG